MPHLTRRLSATAAIMMLAACSAQPPGAGSVPVHALFSDVHCAGEAAGIRRLADSAQWDELRRRITRRYLAAPTHEPAVPDFAREAVFVIDMGQRPTLGYAVKLGSEQASVRGAHIEFLVDWQEPAPGMLQGQMLTSPCMVVSVPAGAYARASVIDERGNVRLRWTGP